VLSGCCVLKFLENLQYPSSVQTILIMDEVAFSETLYACTKIYGVMSHESSLREPHILHPYITFMISPYLFNSSIDPEMHCTYLYADQISFSFLTINSLNYHNNHLVYELTQDIKTSITETVRIIKILVLLGWRRNASNCCVNELKLCPIHTMQSLRHYIYVLAT